MRLSTRVILCAAGVTALLPLRALAQDSDATATALFDSGRKLMAQQRYAEACPQLAQSEKLSPSGGTLLNLAECYEHTGQTASAWAAWKDAAARANAAGKTAAEKKAAARAAALEPTLAKLTVAVAPGSDVAGLEVKRDGIPVGHGELGVPLAVDPGDHVVEASAPRKQPWSTKVTVAARQADARATVTLLDAVEAPAPSASTSPSVTDRPASPVAPAPSAPEASRGLGTQKIVALVAGGLGVVGLGVGAAFGLAAKSDNDQALLNCRTSTLCSPRGLSLTDDAKSAATASTVAFSVGAAAIVGGAVLWLTAPRGAPARAGVRGAVPVIGSSYGGVAVDALW